MYKRIYGDNYSNNNKEVVEFGYTILFKIEIESHITTDVFKLLNA